MAARADQRGCQLLFERSYLLPHRRARKSQRRGRRRKRLPPRQCDKPAKLLKPQFLEVISRRLRHRWGETFLIRSGLRGRKHGREQSRDLTNRGPPWFEWF